MDKLIFKFSAAKDATLLCPFPVKFNGIPDLMDVSSMARGICEVTAKAEDIF